MIRLCLFSVDVARFCVSVSGNAIEESGNSFIHEDDRYLYVCDNDLERTGMLENPITYSSIFPSARLYNLGHCYDNVLLKTRARFNSDDLEECLAAIVPQFCLGNPYQSKTKSYLTRLGCDQSKATCAVTSP